ncbi:hypothetical protein J6590_014891 [Homalodisca vitripennis]|nr:hypothetical protein J6590_014891 [Homalodisca vitripennis]
MKRPTTLRGGNSVGKVRLLGGNTARERCPARHGPAPSQEEPPCLPARLAEHIENNAHTRGMRHSRAKC